MVGVPGKSKGCSTCRRRKKGCDQKRPICGQCASSGYVCGGYNRDRTFILHPASKAVERAIFLPHAKPVPIVLPGAFNRNAVESQCRTLFWDLYMPQGDAMCRDEFILRCGYPMNWTEILHNVPKEDTSLQDAFSALSISRVGQGHKDLRLVHESAKLYGRALKELQVALFDPKRMHSDQVLMACMLLGLYEVFEGPGLNSQTWIAHATGAARLVELRGAYRHQNWDAHHPFLASRIPTVYAAILQRKATYLATEEWLTVPWDFQHRTYFDRMVDLGTLVPGILEQLDCLKSDAGNTQAFRQLLDECKDLQLRINRWKDGTKKSALPRIVNHDPLDPLGYPFETDLWFENHLFVHARIVLYTCNLALSDGVDEIVRELGLRDENFAQSEDLSSLRDMFNAQREAANVCRVVPYCLQPEMGALGASMINFPANLAFQYYRRIGYTPATDWLTKVFESVKTRGLHVENAWNELLSNPGDKEDRLGQLKRESSVDSSEGGSSPGSNHSYSSYGLANQGFGSAFTTTFVYEDPSKAYYDASNDPG